MSDPDRLHLQETSSPDQEIIDRLLDMFGYNVGTQIFVEHSNPKANEPCLHLMVVRKINVFPEKNYLSAALVCTDPDCTRLTYINERHKVITHSIRIES